MGSENCRHTFAQKSQLSLTIALDICKKDRNQIDLKRRHGRSLSPEDVFHKYQAPGRPCHVTRSGVTVEWIAREFRGVAQDLIIAHPFVPVSVVVKPLDVPKINELLRIGATGIEVYHNRTSDAQIMLLENMISDYGIRHSGGSDFHGNESDTPIGNYTDTASIPTFCLSNYSVTMGISKHA